MSAARRMDRPIVVVGAGGMLGRDLVPRLRSWVGEGPDQVIALTKGELDLGSEPGVFGVISRIEPGVVVNCAAYTDVDGCESNVETAMSVNAKGPGTLGGACRRVDALLVHVGTDFIFDGTSRGPYREDDEARPLSVYGRSKWEGEEAIRASGCRHLIVRTSWLFGVNGRNFVEAILAKASAGERLRVVDDQIGRPTHTVDLGEGMIRLLEVGAEGVVHFANEGQCSWHEFAEEIVSRGGMKVAVDRISSVELNRPARRPAYSVLDLSLYRERTGRAPRSWREALADYMRLRESREVSSFREVAG